MSRPGVRRTRSIVAKAGRALAVVAAAGFAFAMYLYATLPDVRILGSENPTSTAFMQLRAREAKQAHRSLPHRQRWVPYAGISANLKRAVLVAEDDLFWQHEGIDVEQIRASIEINLKRGAAVRGGSTITQQLAKNLYLSPSRSPLRKVREFVIARRLEAELSKTRIFEIYLNVIEWGDGVWGAEAAARQHFGVSAAGLSREQAAMLAGAIVNPRVLNPSRPSRRLRRRQQIILARMRRAGEIEAPAAEPTPARPARPPAPDPAESLDEEDTDAPDSADEPDPPAAEPAVPPAAAGAG